MFTMPLTYVHAPAWSGYKMKFLPQRMAMMDPKASIRFAEMIEASESRLQCTDIYRSVQFQIESIAAAVKADTGKARLFAPPSKSGHQFGMSIDVAIDTTLEQLSKSPNPVLREAGKSRDALAEWMAPFGWHGINSEKWHFDFLDGHKYVTERIDAMFGDWFKLTDDGVQTALNEFMGAGLKADGVLGKASMSFVAGARVKLGMPPAGGADPWFRRVLACECIKVEVGK